MDNRSDTVHPLLVSSDAFEGFDAWREEWMLRFLRVDLQVPDPSRFQMRVRALALPKISIIERRSTESVARRARGLLRDGDDALTFNFVLRRTFTHRDTTGQRLVEAGQAIILPLNEASDLFAPGGVRGVSLRLDRATARSVARDAEGWLRRPFPVEASAFRLLQIYLASLFSLPDGLSPTLATLADIQVRELLANAFDPSGDLARSNAHGGLQAARLQAIVQDVMVRLSDPGLSAAAVGLRLGLSERYVQKLMGTTGLSFSEFVRERRLERARLLLADPSRACLRVVDIAAMAGFGDLSHFNRDFRRRFGETPSAARHPR
jgi:AraC-like DNA-binding protein